MALEMEPPHLKLFCMPDVFLPCLNKDDDDDDDDDDENTFPPPLPPPKKKK